MLQLEDPNDWEFGGDGEKLFDLLQTKEILQSQLLMGM
jgi:hypothetical protein